MTDVTLQDLTLNNLLSRFAAEKPLLPAAGSASALIGAVAAAMGAFVATASHRHAKTSMDGESLEKLRDRFQAMAARFADLMEEDVQVYARDPLGPPVKMLESGLELMEMCRGLSPLCHVPARADLQVAVEAALACLRSAAAVTRQNAVNISDDQEAAVLEARIARSLEKARQIQLFLSGGS